MHFYSSSSKMYLSIYTYMYFFPTGISLPSYVTEVIVYQWKHQEELHCVEKIPTPFPSLILEPCF